MSEYELTLMSLFWQARNVMRTTTKWLDYYRKECRREVMSRRELATLRDELAKMDLMRRRIESWLEDFDEDFEEDEEDLEDGSPRCSRRDARGMDEH